MHSKYIAHFFVQADKLGILRGVHKGRCHFKGGVGSKLPMFANLRGLNTPDPHLMLFLGLGKIRIK